jgi:predicted N-acyltransferase
VFYDFYQMTYLKHGMPPYLNIDFFLRCAATMGEKLLLVFALKEGSYVGAALSFVGGDTLYGRYWGCHEEYNALHFEACYYQGLDYCIANGLQRFDSGAQGEHKIARGFEPVTTYSAHWFQDERFAKAIAQFLVREKSAVRFYKEDAANYLPFKNK